MAKSEQVSADHFLLACNPTSIQAIPEAMLGLPTDVILSRAFIKFSRIIIP